MIPRKNILIGYSIYLLTIGCTGAFTENDNGTTIELSEDDNFQIKLSGETDSQYTWQLVSHNISVTLNGPVTKNLMGTKEEYTFNFRTHGDGEDTVRLEYTNGLEIKRTFELKVIVGTFGRILSE